MDDNIWTEAKEMFVRCSVEAALELCDNDTELAADLFGFDMQELRDEYSGEDEMPDDKKILEYVVFGNEAECLLYITGVKRLHRKFYLTTDYETQASDIKEAIGKSMQPSEVMQELLKLGAGFEDDIKIVDVRDLDSAKIYSNDIRNVDRVDMTLMLDMSDIF